MSDNIKESINVTIEGNSGAPTTVVSNIVNKSLEDAGFSNVTMVGENGEPIPSYDPDNTLSRIFKARPDLFTTPITVQDVTDHSEHADRIDAPFKADEGILSDEEEINNDDETPSDD
jgi:hypothetical protein